MIEATGTRRRLQALAVMGHRPGAVLADAPEYAQAVMDGLLDVVDPGTADIVAARYRRLCRWSGTDSQLAQSARAAGWPGPAAWGEDIDDPAVEAVADEPDGTDPATYVDEIAVRKALHERDARPLTRAEREAAALRLGALGLTPGSLANRMGLGIHVARSIQRRLGAAA